MNVSVESRLVYRRTPWVHTGRMIIPIGYAQVNFIGSGTGYARGWQVAIGVENGLGLNPAAIANAAGTCWADNISPVQSNQCALTQVLAKVGPNDTGLASYQSISEDGGVASQAQSSQSAVLVKKTTTHGGRHGQGRMFMPGSTESQSDGGGLLTTAALTAWQAALDGFLSDLAAADIPMYLLHATDTPGPYEVTDLVVQQLFASQRRRIRRVGGRRSVSP